MKRFLLVFSILFVCLGFTGAHAGELEWVTDFNEATNIARSENKPIVAFFTGSDWCGWCKKLDREVFAKGEFATNVGDKFVWFLADFPRNQHQATDIKNQNKGLAQRFAVKGYPTVIILDPNEKIVARTGYESGGPRHYADHLTNLASNWARASDGKEPRRQR